MAESDYEDLTECAMSDELEHELVHTTKNCVFMWTNAKGEPFGVVMSYLPKDGRLWLTAAERRKRVVALRRSPRASICIWGLGGPLGSGRTLTYKGDCVVHHDRATKDWFYPEFARWLRPEPEQADVFQSFLDSPERVVLEFTPDYKLSFDSNQMWSRSPGVNGADQGGSAR